MKPRLLYLLLLLLRFIAIFRPSLLIAPNGKPYLKRWYLTPRGKWWSDRFPRYFLHCFLSSDPNRGFHSHPWKKSKSLILDGEYIETRAHGPYRSIYHFKPGMTNIIKGNDWHRVRLQTKKVWSLFEAGAFHGEEWQFMSENGERRPHSTDTPGD